MAQMTGGIQLPRDKDPKPQQSLKVTDKRIFTPEGELKEDFAASATETAAPKQKAEEPPEETPSPEDSAAGEPNRRNVREPGENPGTPFTLFLESLIVNAYMSMGMLRNPYAPEMPVDLQAARQMIDLIVMLEEKTSGNLSAEESEFLRAHLGELKLKYLQRTKAL